MKKVYIKGIILFIIITLSIKIIAQREVQLTFVGDILLDRGVRKVLDEKGYDYPYMETKNILKKADITFGNLESPITERGTAAYKDRHLIFRGDIKNAFALKEAGFHILNLANNHTMDYRSIGIVDTADYLKKADIKPLGIANSNAPKNAMVIKKNGMDFGFLGYSVFPPEGYIYSEENEDVLRVNIKTIGESIKKAKQGCDYLIVSFHWGNEYEFYPSDDQKNLAHIAIDHGADLVIGHHPHVLQGVERYKEKLIFYSLGNFVFDRQINKGTDETLIVNVKIKNNECKGVRLIPVKIKDCQPQIQKGEKGEYILKRLKKYSFGLNDEIEIKNGLGYIQ